MTIREEAEAARVALVAVMHGTPGADIGAAHRAVCSILVALDNSREVTEKVTHIYPDPYFGGKCESIKVTAHKARVVLDD